MTVDEFVKAKVLPEHQSVVAVLRQLTREAAPNAKEAMYYGLPMYRMNNRVLAWITPSKIGIKLSFRQGVNFEDKYGLLKGRSKWSRYIEIKNLDNVNKEALRYYLEQALELESK